MEHSSPLDGVCAPVRPLVVLTASQADTALALGGFLLPQVTAGDGGLQCAELPCSGLGPLPRCPTRAPKADGLPPAGGALDSSDPLR